MWLQGDPPVEAGGDEEEGGQAGQDHGDGPGRVVVGAGDVQDGADDHADEQEAAGEHKDGDGEEEEEGSWDTEGEGDEEERRALKQRGGGKIYTMPKNITLAKVVLDVEEIFEGQVWIEFYPNGSCSGGDVFVMDTAERTYRIGLEFLTGIVTIREEEEL